MIFRATQSVELFCAYERKIIILISHDKYLEEICDQIIDLDSMKVNAE